MAVRKVPPVTLPSAFGERVQGRVTQGAPSVPETPQSTPVYMTQQEKVFASNNIRTIAAECHLALDSVQRLCSNERTNVLYVLKQEKTSIPRVALEVLARGLGLAFEELVSEEFTLNEELKARVMAAAEAGHLFARKPGNFRKGKRGDL